MEIKLLKCFVVVADELHFGRAAQTLDILPSALGRNIKLLEESLGTRLFTRTTRNVNLTSSGQLLLSRVRPLLSEFETVLQDVRREASFKDRVFRIGAIDSAATGMIPQLLHDFRDIHPDLEVVLEEDKTVKLLPKLETGALDLVFVRPPNQQNRHIHFEHLLYEKTVVALHANSPLANKLSVTVYDLASLPLIVPSPRNRPHSYNLTNNLFLNAGLTPNIAQQAEEKHTIINMVAAEVGVAIIPFWTSRLTVENVVFRPLVDAKGVEISELPLAAAWLEGSNDSYRDTLFNLVKTNLDVYQK